MPKQAIDDLRPEEKYWVHVKHDIFSCMQGLEMLERFKVLELYLPQEKLDLLGRVIDGQIKECTADLDRYLDKVVIRDKQ